jgi:hypothetical protein
MYAAKADWGKISARLKTFYTAPTVPRGRGSLRRVYPTLASQIPDDDRDVPTVLERVKRFLEFPVEIRNWLHHKRHREPD